MERQELYQLLGLQPEMIQKLTAIGEETDLKQIESYLNRLVNKETAAQAYKEMKDYLGEDADNLKMLYCQLECARRAAAEYEKKHIPEKIFADTMKCFARFMQECEKRSGRMYFDRGWWTYRQISMSLFRIGTLEYEFEEHKGENVISIHIPSDADMTKESVDASLMQAKQFFKTYYPDFKYEKYICESWLLAPALRQFLSLTSNILSFQNRFQILEVDADDKDYIEWLFQAPVDTEVEKLPENTRLQKNVKKLLLDGGTVGAALGAMDAAL